jgi:hypothetical protein
MLFEESRVGKGSGGTDALLGKLVAYIRRSVTDDHRERLSFDILCSVMVVSRRGSHSPVSDTSILCPFLAVLGLDLVHELGHEGIREDQMLLHPSLHVEARVLVGVAGVFPVLRHRVLCHNTSSANS